MSQDKSREEFEAWALSKKWLVERDANGNYVNGFVRDAWESWQTSRAAVVVELPDRREGKYCDLRGFNEVKFSDDCRAAIEAAGLKVAP